MPYLELYDFSKGVSLCVIYPSLQEVGGFPIIALLPMFEGFVPILVIAKICGGRFYFDSVVGSPLLHQSYQLDNSSHSFCAF